MYSPIHREISKDDLARIGGDRGCKIFVHKAPGGAAAAAGGRGGRGGGGGGGGLGEITEWTAVRRWVSGWGG